MLLGEECTLAVGQAGGRAERLLLCTCLALHIGYPGGLPRVTVPLGGRGTQLPLPLAGHSITDPRHVVRAVAPVRHPTLQGVTFHSARVDGVTHSEGRSTVSCGDGSTASGSLVLDATGHSRQLVEYDKARVPAQEPAGWGIVVGRGGRGERRLGREKGGGKPVWVVEYQAGRWSSGLAGGPPGQPSLNR